MTLIKNIKILLALTAGSLVIAFGMYFDGKSNISNNEQEALMPNFDEILSQINSIEFKDSKESTIIQDINDFCLSIKKYITSTSTTYDRVR